MKPQRWSEPVWHWSWSTGGRYIRIITWPRGNDEKDVSLPAGRDRRRTKCNIIRCPPHPSHASTSASGAPSSPPELHPSLLPSLSSFVPPQPLSRVSRLACLCLGGGLEGMTWASR